MVSMIGYDRERAIADGLLIDVSDTIAARLGIPYPVAISAALWRHREVDGDREQLEWIVAAGLGVWPFCTQVEPGETSQSLVLDKVEYATFVAIRVVAEPSVGHRIIATILEAGEEYDLRGPRSGSFYLQ